MKRTSLAWKFSRTRSLRTFKTDELNCVKDSRYKQAEKLKNREINTWIWMVDDGMDTWWCLIMHDDISIIHGINKHHTWNEQASCYQQASRVVFGKSWNLKVLSLEGTMWLALNHCMELRANHMVPSRLKTYSLILISEH